MSRSEAQSPGRLLSARICATNNVAEGPADPIRVGIKKPPLFLMRVSGGKCVTN